MEPVSAAWIGFGGSVLGALLAGLTAFWVMRRTNRFNKSLQVKEQRYLFCNEVAILIGEYFSSASVSYYSNREMRNSIDVLCNDKIIISNSDYHEEIVRQNKEIFAKQYNETMRAYFVLLIKLKEVSYADDILRLLDELQYAWINANINPDEFKEKTNELREAATKFISQFSSNLTAEQ